jgi:hypothetical protein
MAMMEFEDRDEESRNAFLHYLQTGKPPAARGADLVFAAISILVSGVIVILPFLAH